MASFSAAVKHFSEQLVLAVSMRPCLFNLKDPGYKDRFKVEHEWDEVGKTLGVPGK